MKLSSARSVTVAAALLLALGTNVAGATSRSACRHLVVDPAGDAGYTETTTGLSQALPSDPGLDLLTADLSASTRTFTAVVRAAASMTTALSPSGHSVELVFRLGGETMWNLSATFPAVGPLQGSLGNVQQGATAVPAAAELSADGRTLTLSVPDAAFTELTGTVVHQGSKVYDVHVYTNRAVAAYNSGVYVPGAADTASTASSYRVGTRSCFA